MSNQTWSWVVSIVGIIGFVFVGRKIWWAWYVNLGAQVLWIAFGLATKQYGFLAASAVYIVVFGQNAYKWTLEHKLAGTPTHVEPVDPLDALAAAYRAREEMTGHWVVTDVMYDNEPLQFPSLTVTYQKLEDKSS